MSQFPGGRSPYGPSPFGGGFGGGMRNPTPYGGGIAGGLMNRPPPFMPQQPMPQMPMDGGYDGSGYAGGLMAKMGNPPRRMPGGPSKGGTTSIPIRPSRGGAPWGGYNPNAESPGGPGKGRLPGYGGRGRGQSRGGSWFNRGRGMPGGPGKARNPRKQTMQPEPFGQKGNNPPQPFFGNNPPQVDLSQKQRPIYSGGPAVPDFGQIRTQGPMNMPQSPFMGYQGQIGRPQPMPFQGGQMRIAAGEMGGNQRMQGLGSPQFSVGGGYGQAPMMNPMAQQAQQGFMGEVGQARTQGPMSSPFMRQQMGFYGGGIMDLYPR